MKKTLWLCSMLALAAACGGAQTPSPNDPTTGPTATGTTGPTGTGGGPTSAPPTAGSDAGTGSGNVPLPTPGVPQSGKMKAIAPTEMAPALKELGLDVKNLPPLNKIPPDKLRKLMGTFKKALGTECTGCHDGDDFKKPTPNKKVAARMWNEFVRGYTMEGGGAVYCDSCHGGKMEFLVRDPGLKQLSAWMDENFVSKMKKTNGQPHSCETCHGDPMEGKFLHTWKK